MSGARVSGAGRLGRAVSRSWYSPTGSGFRMPPWPSCSMSIAPPSPLRSARSGRCSRPVASPSPTGAACACGPWRMSSPTPKPKASTSASMARKSRSDVPRPGAPDVRRSSPARRSEVETRLRAARRGRRVRLPDRRGLLHARHPADPQGPARATRRPSTRRSSARASAQASVSTARATGIYGSLPLFTDGKTHSGSSLHSSATTTLYRNGTKVGSNSDPLEGAGIFKVPAGDAAYKLTTSVKRSVKVAAAFTRVDASWTFRSKKADLDKLPASLIRFDAAVGLDSRAPANKKVS